MGRRQKSTIGKNNPLDTVVPHSNLSRTDTEESQQDPEVSSANEYAKDTKERLTVHLPKPLIDRVKNAVYWTPGLTLASLGQRALEAEVERMEQERGEPFPSRTEELRGGRPMK